MENFIGINFKTIIVSTTILINTLVFSQASPDSPNIYFQANRNSPEANSSAHNASVDLYTGKVNLNIPVYEYSGREINLPISLGYTTGGVKVEELASCVGLGWNLNAGGRVTRIVSHSPDDCLGCDPHEILYHDNKDIYYVTAPGINEYFIMEGYVPRATLNPLITADIRVNDAKEWVIHLPDGTKYVFGKSGTQDIKETSVTDKQDMYDTKHETSTTSWLLTEIVSKNSLDTFNFSYNNFEWLDAVPNNGEGYRDFGFNATYDFLTVSSYKINQQVIKSILHNGEKIIDFTYKVREDMRFANGNNTGNALDKIQFYNYTGQADSANSMQTPYKKVVFDYGYFGDQSPMTNTNYLNRRLKLNKLTFYGIDDANPGGIAGDKYSFDYINPLQVPPITSYAQDFLGLYNGHGSNVNLLHTPSGNERVYNYEKSLAGTLYSVTYPSGGTTIFDFEQNRLNGTFYHYLVPDGAETQISHETLALIDYNTTTCNKLPAAYLSINEPQMQGGDELDLSHFQNAGNFTTGYINEVRTQILRVAGGNISVHSSGTGIYMIQKLATCPGPDTSLNCTLNGQQLTPQSSYNNCLVPTDQLFLTGDTATYSSAGSNFMMGGLSIYGEPSTSGPINFPAGDYQVTLWDLHTGYIDKPKIEVFKETTSSAPEHIHHEETMTDLIEGFRIKSISNYTGIPGETTFAEKKNTGTRMDIVLT